MGVQESKSEVAKPAIAPHSLVSMGRNEKSREHQYSATYTADSETIGLTFLAFDGASSDQLKLHRVTVSYKRDGSKNDGIFAGTYFLVEVFIQLNQ